MNSDQKAQPALISADLFKAQFISGIYRLAGCLLLLDKKQRPYWKMQFSDIHGTICMYMFNQPSEIENLGHGAFVEIDGIVKRYGKQQYIEITDLKKADNKLITDKQALSHLPANYCVNKDDLFRLHRILSMIESRSLLHFIADALPLKTQIEKDLAITGAILHDIGKVKSLDGRMKRLETGQWVDHSALTLEICAQGLSKLEKKNSLYANMLRHTWTCASPGARYGYQPKTTVAEAVQLADRFSAKCEHKSLF